VTGALLRAEIPDGVRTLARREGATPFMELLAALDVVLYPAGRQSLNQHGGACSMITGQSARYPPGSSGPSGSSAGG